MYHQEHSEKRYGKQGYLLLQSCSIVRVFLHQEDPSPSGPPWSESDPRGAQVVAA